MLVLLNNYRVFEHSKYQKVTFHSKWFFLGNARAFRHDRISRELFIIFCFAAAAIAASLTAALPPTDVGKKYIFKCG